MQARHQRRKRLTPIVNPRNENFWVRAMEGMGLQPLHSKKQPVAIMGQEASIAIDAPVPAPSDAVTQLRKTTILDLPNETQKAIFEHCSPPDLLSLALVSKHFRDIAAEHLYRSFHIVFPAYDDSDSDSPTDALASGLETFVTSEYDYGQYVREIVLEPSSGRDHGHNAYREYLTDTSCGKFLNTLLVLTLRKTKALESFKWDIRVELSRQTFKALHDLKALQHLQIRLHAGNSIYNTSPSIPIVPTTANNSFSPFLHPAPPSFTFPPLNPLPIVQPHPIMDGNSGPSSSQFVAGIKTKYKQSKAGLLASVKPRPTLSGFRNLTSLAVLDMDTLDYTSEINQCIVHSWTTLKTLRLSFSETLSNKSRKPAPEIHSDDESDQDDDFTQLVPVPPGVPPPTGPPPPAAPLSSSNDAPTKALKAMEERKKQEAVLAQLLGIDPAIPEPPSPPVPEEMLSEDSKKLLLKDMAPLGKVLLKIIKDGENGRDLGNDALENIAKASKLILETSKLILERGEKKGSSSEPETGGEPDATLKTVPDPPTEAVEDKASENESTERGLFDEPEAKERQKTDSDSDVANPDDIDVEAPELPESTSELETVESEGLQDADEAANESESKSLTHSKASDSKTQSDKSSSGQIPTESQDYTYYLAERKRLQDLIEDLINKRDTIKGMEVEDWQKLENLRTAIDSFLHEMARLDLSFKEKLGGGKTPSTSDDTVEKMSEYVRKTRGLTLDALAIHLIPIKSVVLMRAINVRVLTSVTLLRVGHQNLFWASLAKENKISPLPLRKIYSDNITLHFLALVHQLECVEELLMVERKQNVLLESITPKTTVTIDQIRRTVLKKHLGTLKVLMIQNDDTPDWDMNTETAVLICRRGKELEELAVSFGIRTMHTLLQFMPGLTKLRALHTLIFRHDDTCMWVMREFRKFAVDIISHNPHMKLEWLALGETVVRLVREIPNKVDKKGKGKAKQGIGKGKNLAGLVSSAQPLGGLPTQATLSLLNMGISPNMMLALDDSDDEDLRIGGKNGLIVETITGVEFSDVPGVRIFETDALIGRL